MAPARGRMPPPGFLCGLFRGFDSFACRSWFSGNDLSFDQYAMLVRVVARRGGHDGLWPDEDLAGFPDCPAHVVFADEFGHVGWCRGRRCSGIPALTDGA